MQNFLKDDDKHIVFFCGKTWHLMASVKIKYAIEH